MIPIVQHPNNPIVQYRSNPAIRQTVAEVNSADAVDLAQLLRTLWTGKWLIMIVTALTIFMGGYYAYIMATPLYRSQATVILNSRENQLLDIEGVIGGLSSDLSVVNSELEVLRSRSLMGDVVDMLELTEDPEFNSALREPSRILELESLAKTFVKDLLGLSGDAAGSLSEEERIMREREFTDFSVAAGRNGPKRHPQPRLSDQH